MPLHFDVLAGFPRSAAWLLCSSTAIITTRLLLLSGVHFPIHILLLDYIASQILRVLQRLLCSNRRPCHTNQPWTAPGATFYIPWSMLSALFKSCAWICGFQALLHVPTLSTTMMILTLASLPRHILDKFTSLCETRCQLFLRSACFAVGVLIIFVLDYRLYSTGMVFACLYHVFYNVSSFAAAWAHDQSTFDHDFQYDVVMVSTALTPVLFALWINEDPLRTSLDLSRFPTLLGANIVFGAATLRYWNDMYVPESKSGLGEESWSRCPLLLPLIQTSIVCGADAILGPPTTVSLWQWTGFLLSLISAFHFEQMPSITWQLAFPRTTLHRSDIEAKEAMNVAEKATAEDTTRHHTSEGHDKNLGIPCIRALSLCLMAWVLLTYRALYPVTLTENLSTFSNDLTYEPPRLLDVVIARYDEPIVRLASLLNTLLQLPNVAPLEPMVWIYNKNPTETAAVVVEGMKAQFPNSSNLRVIDRLNLGREGETHLNHIVEKWDTLAEHTIFMQADAHSRLSIFKRVEDYLVPQTGFLSLSYVGELCRDCSHCTDRSGWIGHAHTINDIFKQANHGAQCRNLVMTYKGQFAVSARRIRGNGKELYTWLLDELTNLSSSVHQPDFWHTPQNWDRVDSLEDPVFGFTLERMWGAIMQCSELRVAYRCPSLMSGLGGRYGPVDNCQCLD